MAMIRHVSECVGHGIKKISFMIPKGTRAGGL
jgi:hypothetical protein